MTGRELAILNKLWEELVRYRDSYQERSEVASNEPLRSCLQGLADGYRGSLKLLDKAMKELVNG